MFDLVPFTMRARHIDTGEWHTLILDDHAYMYWRQPASECYYVDDDELQTIDLYDYDSFEGETYD